MRKVRLKMTQLSNGHIQIEYMIAGEERKGTFRRQMEDHPGW